MIKKIGILTSGGDCAGLNAAISAAMNRAYYTYGWKIYGIRNGTTGLITRPVDYVELKPEQGNTNLLRTGGTILGTTTKDNPFNFPNSDGTFSDRSQEFIDGYHSLELDAILAIGGDGSMHIIRKLAEKGHLNLVAIPKTIDNDIGLTESSIGFTTAVEVATEALDRLQPTAASHQRIMILEVMGRDAGHIALNAGIAGGADIILIPEISYTLEGITHKLKQLFQDGRNFALIIVSEAVKTKDGSHVTLPSASGRIRYGGIGNYLGNELTNLLKVDTRVTVLGHVQRGGAPNAQDRVLASAFGVAAVDLIAEKKFDRMVAWNNRNVVDVPIKDAIKNYHSVDLNSSLVKTAIGLNIYLGDLGKS